MGYLIIPLSQGTIERFHYTIKKYLSKEFISNGCNNICFEECRIKIMNYYNNKIHRLIKTTTNLAYKINDPEKIKAINEIKDKEFEKINCKRTYLKTNDLCLLNPKFLLFGKKTLILNKVKKGKFSEKIPVRIIDRSSFGYYVI